MEIELMPLSTRGKCLVGASFAVAISAAVSANPMQITFTELENNHPLNLAAQFSATMTNNGDGTVTFRIMNDITVAYASVTDVYFYDGQFVQIPPAPIYQNGPGVNMATGNNPANLPGYNAQQPLSVFSSAGSPGNPANGIDGPGEWLDVTFLMAQPFANLVSAINSGEILIGLKVQSILGGDGPNDSESYISNGGTLVPPPIPLPSAGLMAMAGVLGIGAVRRRR